MVSTLTVKRSMANLPALSTGARSSKATRKKMAPLLNYPAFFVIQLAPISRFAQFLAGFVVMVWLIKLLFDRLEMRHRRARQLAHPKGPTATAVMAVTSDSPVSCETPTNRRE